MAEALVSFLVEQLGSITYQQVEQKVRLVMNVKKEVTTLTFNLEAIQAVLADAEMRQVKEANVRRWLSNLKEVSCEIDDVLDEWSTEILKQQIEKQDNEGETAILAKKKVCFSIPFHCLCFGQVNQIILRQDIAMRIKELNEKLALINEQRKVYKFHHLEKDIEQPERLKSFSIVDKYGTFGRDYEKNILVNQLLSENSQERRGPLVISIVGMGGIGKTTLAQLAYNDKKVQAYFDKTIWVCVSEPFVLPEVAKSIIKRLSENSKDLQTVLNSNDLETLGQHVYKSIEGRKFLLVLDDVWDSSHTKWDLFMRTLQGGARGSRILVTTRIGQVASVMGATPDHTIHLRELSEEICRSLFYHIAYFDGERKESKMFEEVGNEIVKKCKGLPLAAETLGSLMRSKKTIQQWQDVLNNKIWELQEVEQEVFQPLLLSYYDLESPIKRCLLYCATFPKDYVFDKDELIELWMSQDYLNVKGENKGNKIIGQRYFENLVMRSFFQDFVEDVDGNIIRCKMHDIVHDFVLYLTKDECFTVVVKGANKRMELPGDEVRHLTLLFAPKGPFPVSFLNNSKSLRTLASFDSNLTSIGVEAFSQLNCLRTLNLRSNPITEVPKEIGGLIHLRYLDLSENHKLKELPDNLCDLFNLQTLRLTKCRGLVKLPNEEAMRKLTKLKHLYVEGSCRLKSKGIRGLRNLKTLDVFHVHRGDDNEGLRLEAMEKLHQLKGTLRIRNLKCVNDASEAAKAMTTVNHVHRGDDNEGLRLKDLEKLHQLEGTLRIRNLKYVKDASEAAKAMTNVKHILLHLELDFGCERCGGPILEETTLGEEIVNALQPHPDLESLCIRECSTKTLCPNWMMSLHKLTRLALLICRNCEVLPPLGKLPSLESLEINQLFQVKKVGVEFLGIAPSSSSSSSGSSSAILFPKLKKLVFRFMDEWEEWEGVAGWTEDSQIKIMPSLNYLQFECVPVLKTLPNFLRKTMLQHLVIKYSSPYLSRIVRRRRGEAWAKISHIP